LSGLPQTPSTRHRPSGPASRTVKAVVAGLGLVLALSVLGAWWAAGMAPAPQAASAPRVALPAWAIDPAVVARGARVATQAHCAGCHTAPGGLALAGPRRIDTPFGAVQAGNLTPDPATGLGAWTPEDFRRALQHGRGRDGRALVPAFPYPHYTRMAEADIDALYAWLQAQPAVVQARPPHELRPWAGHPWSLALWQTLFFRPGPLPLPADAPADWRRGAQLVHGEGHCGACHAPRNAFGASRQADDGVGEALDGTLSPDGRTYAPPLPGFGAAGVDRQALVELLRTGQSAWGTAHGPMGDVVQGSTQHWPEADLQAVAAYLASRPAPKPLPAAARAPEAVVSAGRAIYERQCAECHGESGQGAPGRVPPLAGNPTVLHPDPGTLIDAVRHGGFAPVTAAHPRPFGMPPTELDASDMAALLTMLRQSWGHTGEAVTPMQVLRTR